MGEEGDRVHGRRVVDAPLLAVGTPLREGALLELADAVAKVLDAGYASRAEQQTIREALDVFRHIAKVENVSINGSTFTNHGAEGVAVALANVKNVMNELLADDDPEIRLRAAQLLIHADEMGL